MWNNFAARFFKAEGLILAASSDYHNRKQSLSLSKHNEPMKTQIK